MSLLLDYEVSQADIERFFKYVEKLPNGCWFWNGARTKGKGNKKWYGSFKIKVKGKRKTIKAHAYSCDVIAKRGPLPPGHERDHTCKFSLCVNHEHIEVVTKQVNGARRWEGRRKSGLAPTSEGMS